MRIAIDARFYGLEHAGLGRYTVNLIRELQQLDRKNQYIVILKRKYFNEVKLGKNWLKVEGDFPHYSLSEQIKMPQLLNDIHPDLVHFLHFNVPIFCRCPYVVTIHDMIMHHQGFNASNQPLPTYIIKRMSYKLIFSHAVNSALKVIVPSKFVHDQLINYYNLSTDKVYVAYEGTDPMFINQGYKIKAVDNSTKNAYFIYTGRLYPHKNVSRLIEAIADLNKRQRNQVSLMIVSAKDKFRDRIERLVVDLNIKDKVNFLGYVGDKELNSLYRNSVGFVFPTLSEGFGIPGLEAMSSGTLVLASAIPVLKEVYGNASLYFDPNDPRSISASLEKALLMDNETRKAYLKKGKELSEHYSWKKMAEEVLKIYESCNSI